LAVTRLVNGQLRLSFEAEVGRSYSLLVTSVLGRAWLRLSNFTPESNGVIAVDIDFESGLNRFFKLVTPAVP
jgi:hypothetical protein